MFLDSLLDSGPTLHVLPLNHTRFECPGVIAGIVWWRNCSMRPAHPACAAPGRFKANQLSATTEERGGASSPRFASRTAFYGDEPSPPRLAHSHERTFAPLKTA